MRASASRGLPRQPGRSSHDPLDRGRRRVPGPASRPGWRVTLVHGRILVAWAGLSGQSSARSSPSRSEEHTSELQSQFHLVCRLLLEKKKKKNKNKKELKKKKIRGKNREKI